MARTVIDAAGDDPRRNLRATAPRHGPPSDHVVGAHFDALTADGTIIEPLRQAPWGDTFGACVDRFGTSWMVNIVSPSA